jgi:adenine phosphoribosyltransferase
MTKKEIDKTIAKILYTKVKEYPNFPTQGVIFKDILPLVTDPTYRTSLISLLEETVPEEVTCVVAPESRGFLLGILVATSLQLKFVPIRKPGKLPGDVISKTYNTEYSRDTLELQADVLSEDDICWFIDDIYATGGTYDAIKTLVNTEASLLGGTILLDVLGNKPDEIIELFKKEYTNAKDKVSTN